MDVAKFLDSRSAELQVYVAHLQKVMQQQKQQQQQNSCESTSKTSVCSSNEGVLIRSRLYRRPSSRNVPLSRVLEDERRKMMRKRGLASRFDQATQQNNMDAQEAEEEGSRRMISGSAADVLRMDQKEEDEEESKFWFTDTGMRVLPPATTTSQIISSSSHGSNKTSGDSGGNTNRSSPSLKKAGKGGAKSKAVLSYKTLKLFEKRKHRLALATRRVAKRRQVLRRVALRIGKQAAAALLAPNKKRKKKKCADAGGIGVIEWLPSHMYLRKRCSFTYLRRICSISEDDDDIGEAMIRLHVPIRSLRRQHRALQRWVAHGSSQKLRDGSALQPQHLEGLLADCSHFYVWTIHRTTNGADDAVSHNKGLSTLDVAKDIGVHVCQSSSARSEEEIGKCDRIDVITASHSTESASEVDAPHDVVRGFMWRDGSQEVQELGSVEASPVDAFEGTECSDDARVVPVVLFSVPSRESHSRSPTRRWILIAPARVHVNYRARGKHLAHPGRVPSYAFTLISSWKTVSSTPSCRLARASVFEWWLSSSSSSSGLPLQDVAKQRVASVLKHAHRTTTLETMHNLSSTAFLVPQSLFSNRSALTSPVQRPSFQDRTRVYWIIVHSELAMKDTSTSPVSSKSDAALAVANFTLSRRMFLKLLSRHTKRGENSSSVLPPHPASAPHTLATRYISLEDRRDVLRLCGVPAYPWDFSDTSSNRKDSTHGLALDRCEKSTGCVANPCSLHRYMTPSRGSQFVLLQFPSKGHRTHQREGCFLLELEYSDDCPAKGPFELLHIASRSSSLKLKRVGVITSQFFSQQFGCRVALAFAWEKLHEGHVGEAAASSSSAFHRVLYFTASPTTVEHLTPSPTPRLTTRPSVALSGIASGTDVDENCDEVHKLKVKARKRNRARSGGGDNDNERNGRHHSQRILVAISNPLWSAETRIVDLE